MSDNRRRHHRLRVCSAWLAAAVIAGLATTGVVHRCQVDHQPQEPTAGKAPDSAASTATPPPAATPFRLSDLVPPPPWSDLAVYQETITREEFTRLLTEVFTVGNGWREQVEIGPKMAAIETVPGTRFLLRFAEAGRGRPVPRSWRTAAELDPCPADKPLTGLHIAIDPGHIGGPWARMEERWFSVNGLPPVAEGDLTQTVARLLQPRLEALGAKVSLVRGGSEPVTRLRPDTIAAAVEAADEASLAALPVPRSPGEPLRLFAERLFYRTAEIRARADIINATLKPDLVLCLHFNAEAWGDPAKPELVSNNHFHAILSGAFIDAEIALPDQRCDMLRKLLERTHEEELAVCTTVATVFATASGLPPYQYEPKSTRARNLADNPFLWARNLLANRLYHCPVVFLEPYVMNSPEVHARIQAGDYPGVRELNGRPCRSIFREYADAVTKGLADYYQTARNPKP